MLVVVASRFDADAAGFVRLRHDAGARLLTCDGVTRRGCGLAACGARRPTPCIRL